MILAQITLIRVVTFMSCLVCIINRTLSNQARQFSFVSYIERAYMIGHVVVLSHFCHRVHTIQSILKFSIAFYGDHTYKIDQVVVLFVFHNILNPAQSVMKIQFRFRHRPHWYDQSCCQVVWSLLQIVYPIGSIMIIQFRFLHRVEQ